MVVVAHHSVSAKVNCKHGTQQLDSINDPLAAVFEVKTRGRAPVAQEGTPYAA